MGDTNAWVDIFGLSYEEVREVQKGEKILDLIREAKRETFLEGKEYAVIKRKDGKRYLVSGDKGKNYITRRHNNYIWSYSSFQYIY